MISIPQHVRDKIIAYYEEDLNYPDNLTLYSGLEIADFRLMEPGEVWTNPAEDSEVPALILDKKKWQPRMGAKYNYVDEKLQVNCYIWNGDVTDIAMLKAGNVFQAQEQAQEAADKMKALLKGLPK